LQVHKILTHELGGWILRKETLLSLEEERPLITFSEGEGPHARGNPQQEKKDFRQVTYSRGEVHWDELRARTHLKGSNILPLSGFMSSRNQALPPGERRVPPSKGRTFFMVEFLFESGLGLRGIPSKRKNLPPTNASPKQSNWFP